MKNKQVLHILTVIAFLLNSIMPYSVGAQNAILPQPIARAGLTNEFVPPTLAGIKIHPENPFLLDFIINQGSIKLSPEAFAAESEKLVKYFLASLTVPDQESWVNLSPTEKDRIIPDALGQTTMGKVMLEQDYLLKQLASSLTNPDEKIGQEFWSKVRAKVGSDEIPMETMNKVWIVPGEAEVLESKNIALIGEKSLKVMMADEYEASHPQTTTTQQYTQDAKMSSQVFKETILPSIQKEVNEGKNFADIRQVYNSVILAAWYKKTLKDSLLGHIYADQNKIVGIQTDDFRIKQKVYEKYLEAFKKGAYSMIREEADPVTGDLIPRKYFSGGFVMAASSGLTIHTLILKDAKARLAQDGAFELGFAQFEMRLESPETTPSVLPEFLVSDPTTSSPGDLDERGTLQQMYTVRFLGQFRNERGKVKYEAIRRFDTFMVFLQSAEQMTGEDKSYRIRFLLQQMGEDVDFGTRTQSIRRSIYKNMSSDPAYATLAYEDLLERIDEKLYAVLEDSYAKLSEAYPGWREFLPPEDFFISAPTDPIDIIIQELVDGVVRRVFSGGPGYASIPLPQDVREGLTELMESIFADMSALPPRNWYSVWEVVDTFANYQIVQRAILEDLDTTNKILNNYYPKNDLYYRSLGIRPDTIITSSGGYAPAISMSKELLNAIKAELSAYFEIPSSATSLTTTAPDSLTPTTPKTPEIASIKPKPVQNKNLSRKTTTELEEMVSAITQNSKHRDIITLAQWRTYYLGVTGTNQETYRDNLIEMIEDFGKYEQSGREDFLPNLALAQEIIASLSALRSDRRREGFRNDLPSNYNQMLEDEISFASRLLAPTKDTPIINSQEDTEVWINRASKLIDIKEKADLAREAASTAINNENVGGIDFNKNNLNLQIKRDGNGVVLPVLEQNLEQIRIDGLVPVLIKTGPVNAWNLPELIQTQ